jgi:hypothetical protein
VIKHRDEKYGKALKTCLHFSEKLVETGFLKIKRDFRLQRPNASRKANQGY